jgi:hypothetical protein
MVHSKVNLIKPFQFYKVNLQCNENNFSVYKCVKRRFLIHIEPPHVRLPIITNR